MDLKVHKIEFEKKTKARNALYKAHPSFFNALRYA